MPAISLRSVDLPEPFSPITPKVLPAGTSKDTPPRAVKVSPGVRSDSRLPVNERALQRAELVLVQEAPIDLGHIPRLHGEWRAHTSSASVSRSRSKSQAPSANIRTATAAVASKPRPWWNVPSNSACW